MKPKNEGSPFLFLFFLSRLTAPGRCPAGTPLPTQHHRPIYLSPTLSGSSIFRGKGCTLLAPGRVHGARDGTGSATCKASTSLSHCIVSPAFLLPAFSFSGLVCFLYLQVWARAKKHFWLFPQPPPPSCAPYSCLSPKGTVLTPPLKNRLCFFIQVCSFGPSYYLYLSILLHRPLFSLNISREGLFLLCCIFI